MPEIVVSNTFQAGQIMVFTILMFPLFFLQIFFLKDAEGDIELRLLLKAIIFGFLFFTRYQLYEVKNKYSIMFKIATQIILVYLLYNQVIARIIVYLLH